MSDSVDEWEDETTRGGIVRKPPVRVDSSRLVRMVWTVRALAVLLVLCIGIIGITLPRSLAYREVFDENLAIKAELSEIDDRLAELDRLLLRLRVYDAEVRSIGEPSGDHGPLPPGTVPEEGLDFDAPVVDGIEEYEQLEGGPMDGEAMDGPAEELPNDVMIVGADGSGPTMDGMLQPAEDWAASVSARLDTIVGRLATAEPDLTTAVGELESLRAIERALPGVWPAAGTLTSGFGWRRSPFTRRWKFHAGLDVANDRGTPIIAPADGRVVKAEYNSGYGRMVELDHGFGIHTIYAHCQALNVREGEYVQRGDLLGTIGSTGQSTGPHLHFEVRLEGHAVDPLDYLPR